MNVSLTNQELMRPYRPFFARVASLTSAIAIAACTTATDPTPIATIQLQPAIDSIEVGQTYNGWIVTLRDLNGVTLTGRTLTWESSNTAVATVDASTGLVTAVSGPSAALITVRAEGKTAQSTIKVINTIVAIVATPDSFDLPMTTTRTISVALVGSGGVAITNRTITWSTSNPAVAVVSGTGVVTAVSPGTASIFIDAGTKRATVRVRVVAEPVTSVRITPQQSVHIVRLGQTKQLAAECLNAAQQVLTGRAITWNSSNPVVATVSSTGLVSGNSIGTASISATCEGTVSSSTTAQVTLVPVASVSISPNGLSLAQGTQGQLTVTARDSANNVLSLQGRQVAWFSDNIPVAPVSNQGVVSGSSIGVAQITVNVSSSVDNVTSAPVTVDVHAFFAMLNELAPATPTRFEPGLRRVTRADQGR